MQTKVLKIIVSFTILMMCCKTSYLFYFKTHECLDVGKSKCNKWNNTISIFYNQGFAIYLCFPEKTYVLTENGIKNMKDLQVGQKILGYNFQKDHIEFSQVTAWLHRDTQSKTEFTAFQTEASHIYKASGRHNIAFNNDGQIGFKYAEQINQNDQLITIDGVAKVNKAGSKSYETGLYSPMTQNSNFFIFGNNSFNKLQKNKTQMILVHCLSEVNNPHNKQHFVSNLLKVTKFLGLNSHQNLKQENYVHPITHLFPFFANNQFKIKHLVASKTNQSLQIYSQHGQKVHHRVSSSNGQQQRKLNSIKTFTLFDQMHSLIIS